MIQIKELLNLSYDELKALSELLLDSVYSNSSVGFMADITLQDAHSYWVALINSLCENHILLIALDDAKIVGTVQLIRCDKSNGRHRGEICKLLVISTHHGRAIARQLMAEAENMARNMGILLLILDTQTGSVAESVYCNFGWIKSGEIPYYALTPDGKLCSTSYFYKQLD